MDFFSGNLSTYCIASWVLDGGISDPSRVSKSYARQTDFFRKKVNSLIEFLRFRNEISFVSPLEKTYEVSWKVCKKVIIHSERGLLHDQFEKHQKLWFFKSFFKFSSFCYLSLWRPLTHLNRRYSKKS